ncbi:apolipoprotein N-acyltransferase [uncultured Maribacter sp.]|uniref:apolipoprotein N-acyltransferase n=1 Tax=uncultured Maribacter sp. TaxID=431308 RepID=UPI002636FFB4|nr:apolipoprotein N-acyltransferase [uncultured Maribacter sp.]
MKKNKIQGILLLTAVFLFIVGWLSVYFSFLLLFAFIPLLVLFENTSKGKLLIVYIVFILWHSTTIFWIYKINEEAFIAISLINSLFFLTPFVLYKYGVRKYNYLTASFLFIVSWVSIEFLHHKWGFAFPYMTLGNGLADIPRFIQWYEYTGVLGGSLWILAANFFLYGIVRKYRNKEKFSKVIVVEALIVIFLPMVISIAINTKSINKKKSVEVVSVHTNADCYNFKYKVSPKKLVNHYLDAILPNITENTSFIILPETAIKGRYWIGRNKVKESGLLKYIKDTIKFKSPNVNLISGIFLNQVVNEKDKIAAYAHFNKKYKRSFYKYNGAINIDPNTSFFEYRTKQKLVPMEESTPYPSIMSGLKGVVKSLGNFNFYYEKEDGKVFYNKSIDTKASMLICYESLFGEETTKHTKNGAEVLFVGLNEGWYKNLKAASHFNNFGVLRAIENRRYVVRSSNDGISSIIDPKGTLVKQTSEFKPSALKATVFANKTITFYVKYGDYIGRLSVIVLGILIIYNLVFKLFIKVKSLKKS